MKKYGVIYADPPWKFSNRALKRTGPDGSKSVYAELDKDHYATMTIDEIKRLDISSIAAENSVLFLWTTDAHLEYALQVIKAWGFTYKTIGFTWVKKTSTGKQAWVLGPYGMKGSEICLLATKGKGHSLIEARNVRQVIESSRGVHSQKPTEARSRIEAMFSKQEKVELFAREKFEGWDSWGNEIKSDLFINNEDND